MNNTVESESVLQGLYNLTKMFTIGFKRFVNKKGIIMYRMFICIVGIAFVLSIFIQPVQCDRESREAYLDQLMSVLPDERPERGQVSPLDATWKDWLERTGELPPDFDEWPSIPLLPDPLVLDEGKSNIPVTTMSQWREKRDWMQNEIQHWITGTFLGTKKD